MVGLRDRVFQQTAGEGGLPYPGEEKGKGGEPTSEDGRGKQGYSERKSKIIFNMPVLDAFLVFSRKS